MRRASGMASACPKTRPPTSSTNSTTTSTQSSPTQRSKHDLQTWEGLRWRVLRQPSGNLLPTKPKSGAKWSSSRALSRSDPGIDRRKFHNVPFADSPCPRRPHSGRMNLSQRPGKRVTDISMGHVPYRGGAPALTDTISGQVQATVAAGRSAIAGGPAGKDERAEIPQPYRRTCPALLICGYATTPLGGHHGK